MPSTKGCRLESEQSVEVAGWKEGVVRAKRPSWQIVASPSSEKLGLATVRATDDPDS